MSDSISEMEQLPYRRRTVEKMSPEERRKFEDLLTNPGTLNPYPKARQTKFGEVDENGVDWSLLRSALRMTYDERAIRSCRGTAQAMMNHDVSRAS
ncbi:MAG: hypothetical protein AAF656_09585 [Planctomycetota bacterium]